MNRKLKYIRTRETFIVFAEPTSHSKVGKGLETISAGFCYQTVSIRDSAIYWTCNGESISLKLKSLPEDSELLTNQMNGNF